MWIFTEMTTIRLLAIRLLVSCFAFCLSRSDAKAFRRFQPIVDLCPAAWHQDVLCERFGACSQPVWSPKPVAHAAQCTKGRKSAVTMVAALFDVKSADQQGKLGHSLQEYLVWMQKTISINANTVLFTTPREFTDPSEYDSKI